ncbi:dual specificity protein phosphatase 22-B-like protein [Leptotrombidium deliense]|uniref:Dual specificity protein phosphatase 22-B-like protein n=1 Tax=Leptotrombidium deliense TaxID=299467 RepID=A0A443SS88_9ACAR|nr:dual specificity protein phosphatase 22-B-like protein [Leptotrombidium deliense]
MKRSFRCPQTSVSRSVTIAVAYVMSVTSLNWKDALKCVRGARAIANPNLGFQKQLQDFEGRRLRERTLFTFIIAIFKMIDYLFYS